MKEHETNIYNTTCNAIDVNELILNNGCGWHRSITDTTCKLLRYVSRLVDGHNDDGDIEQWAEMMPCFSTTVALHFALSSSEVSLIWVLDCR